MSKNTNFDEIIKSVRLTDKDSGAVYELDFCRESVVFAERNEFTLEKAIEYPVTGMRDLFYYAFRMHHRNVARDKTDKMIEKWGGGIPESLFKRLIQLYSQAQSSNVLLSDEEAKKNASLTLEM